LIAIKVLFFTQIFFRTTFTKMIILLRTSAIISTSNSISFYYTTNRFLLWCFRIWQGFL